MQEVIIVPTNDTSWGVDDRYDIRSKDLKIVLHENVEYGSLEDIIADNDYKVIGGEKYL